MTVWNLNGESIYTIFTAGSSVHYPHPNSFTMSSALSYLCVLVIKVKWEFVVIQIVHQYMERIERAERKATGLVGETPHKAASRSGQSVSCYILQQQNKAQSWWFLCCDYFLLTTAPFWITNPLCFLHQFWPLMLDLFECQVSGSLSTSVQTHDWWLYFLNVINKFWFQPVYDI